MNGKVRVQFNLSKETLTCVDEMKKITGASTRAEVLRAALACYKWILTKNQENKKIAAIDGATKQVKETLSPFLLYRG